MRYPPHPAAVAQRSAGAPASNLAAGSSGQVDRDSKSAGDNKVAAHVAHAPDDADDTDEVRSAIEAIYSTDQEDVDAEDLDALTADYAYAFNDFMDRLLWHYSVNSYVYVSIGASAEPISAYLRRYQKAAFQSRVEVVNVPISGVKQRHLEAVKAHFRGRRDEEVENLIEYVRKCFGDLPKPWHRYLLMDDVDQGTTLQLMKRVLPEIVGEDAEIKMLALNGLRKGNDDIEVLDRFYHSLDFSGAINSQDLKKALTTANMRVFGKSDIDAIMRARTSPLDMDHSTEAAGRLNRWIEAVFGDRLWWYASERVRRNSANSRSTPHP